MDRREFLKELGLVGSAGMLLSVFPWLQGCSEAARREVAGERARLGVIGTGSRGMYHLQNLLNTPEAEIVALCDIYPPHLQQAAKLFPEATCYTDYHDLLRDANVQGVLIVTPLSEHAPMSVAALQADKHVFCEKAMAHTIEQCKQMYDTWKATGKVLYIGQQRLFDPKYIRAVELINEGRIGEVVALRNFWFRNNDWRRPVPSPELERLINWRLYRDTSCGLMTELGCHHLQNGTWILRSLPDYIMGSGDIVYWKDGREVYDSVSVTYHYPSGVKMTFESVIANKHFGMDEQILGSKGTLALSHNRLFSETPPPRPGIRQLLSEIGQGLFQTQAFAGTSWAPEHGSQDPGVPIVSAAAVHEGASTVGAAGDGSEEMIAAFCRSVITGRQAERLVEEAYYAGLLSLLGLQAMEEHRIVEFPKEYVIPYL